jgi:hypothetical protein
MADDISYRLRPSYGGLSSHVPDTILLNGLMQELAQLFLYNGVSVTSFDLPLLPDSSQNPNRLIMEELLHNQQDLFTQSISLCSQLNEDQRSILHIVCSGECFTGFVSGHGGTGKTFLWRAIMATLRSRGHTVLVVVSSGVASLLLPGGRTTHSRFRIPLDLHEESRCAIVRGTNLAELLCRASLIIWDEAAHNHCFEAVDRTLRGIVLVDDVRNLDIPFGGKHILLGGGFRPVLPVMQGADRSEIIRASLLSSCLWTHFTVMRLTVNMRLASPGMSEQMRSSIDTFARWVLDVGEGIGRHTSFRHSGS